MELTEAFKAAAAQPADAGRALPFRCYSDPAFYEAETRDVFHRDWVFVCAAGAISEPGDRFAADIAGTQVVVVRGKDGQLRALSNNCAHRGTPIADMGLSQGARLVCPYHSWNFNLDGSLRGAPYTGAVEIDKTAHCLPEFALEEWCGLVFVNIEGNAGSLAERYAPIVPYLARYGCATPNFGIESETEVWASNWKLAVENAMESYHLFKVHRETLETVSPTKGAFFVEGCEEWSLTAGEYSGVYATASKFLGGGKGPSNHYLLVCLPPSFVGILTLQGSWSMSEAAPAGALGYLSMLPDGPGRTYARTGTVATKAPKRTEDERGFTAAFLAEDKWICERAYTGMHTRHARGGQFVELERVVQNFHRYLGNRLCGLPLSPTYRNPAAREKGLVAQSGRE